MLFAHAPAGFLAAFLTKRWWAREISAAQIRILLIFAAVFGILPDLDVLYYYFFNARILHREIFSHSFFLYLIITAIALCISLKFKNKFWQAIAIVFFASTMSHLLFDSLAAGIMWLYPFDFRLFGLLIVPSIANSFFGLYFTLINFILEIVLTLLALGVIVYQYFPQNKRRFHLMAVGILAIVTISCVFVTPRVYRPTHPALRYQDTDNDRSINLYDSDMDGDKKTTFNDRDVDGDSALNNDEIIKTALAFSGKLRDPFEGEFFEILPRYGFITNSDIIRNTYESAGIFLSQLMIEDYQKNPHLYQNSPRDSGFSRNLYNIFIFFRNNGMLVDGNRDTERGDVVFYGNDFKHISIIVRKNVKLEKEVLVLDGLTAKVVLSNEAIKKFGAPLAAARLKKR